MKERVNSSYGMTVQRVDQSTTEYDPETGLYSSGDPDLQESLNKYYKSRNSFLSYQWGVWVTAHARAALQRILDITGADTVYCDTDSDKCIGDHDAEIEKLNEELKARAKEAGAFAYDRNGNIHYCGVYEKEQDYDEFKTLGAKKYVVKIGDQCYSTIAGVSKKIGSKFFTENGLDSFRIGSVIPDSGHLVAYYNDSDIHRIKVNGCIMTTASNVALVDDTYTIGVTDDYLSLLEKAKGKIVDINYYD